MSTRRGQVVEVSPETLRERLADARPRTAPGGREQRTDTRVEADLQLEIPLPTWEQARRVYTTNISAGGLMFRIERPVKLAGQAKVTLALPDGQTITLDSEIRHAASIPGTQEIEVGVQFKAVPEEVHQALEAALTRLARPRG